MTVQTFFDQTVVEEPIDLNDTLVGHYTTFQEKLFSTKNICLISSNCVKPVFSLQKITASATKALQLQGD